MTTIAYRDGVLAADSLACWGDTRDSYVTKIAKRGQVLATASGNVSGINGFLDWFRSGAEGEPPRPVIGDGVWFGLLITPDDWMLLWTPGGWERSRAEMTTMGSGGDFARGAMEAGASPEEAVRIALRVDTKSGGDISVLRRDPAA